MKREYRYLLLAVIVGAIIGMLAAAVPHTVLYTLENDTFPSRFHENVDALRLLSVNSTTDVLPLLQQLTDSSGPVAMNIRIRDVDEARRELAIFSKNNIRVNNLVVTLDMDNSQIQDLSKNSAKQRELLSELLNSSVSMDTLDKLEIQYRDTNDPDLQRSVQFQKNALVQKMREIRDQYRNSTETIVAISNRTGLDPISQERSLEEVQTIVRAVDKPVIPVAAPATGTYQLTLIVNPDSGVYGDTITSFGSLISSTGSSSGVRNRPLTLYLDGAPLVLENTDSTGSYSHEMAVNRIDAGKHVLYSRWDSTRSAPRTLTIHAVDSVTNLSVTQGSNWSEANCTGTVFAGRPVSNAPVELAWDGTNTTGVITDGTGSFATVLVLPPGTHMVTARFSGDGYPIRPSASEPQDITITKPVESGPFSDLLALVIIAGGVFCLFVVGAVFYLRRVNGKRAARPHPEMGPDSTAGSTPDVEWVPASLPESLSRVPDPDGVSSGDETLTRLFAKIIREEGLSAAAHLVYHTLTLRLAGDLGIRQHQTLTPRELSRSCRGRNYCGAFFAFVELYERIRYAGAENRSVRNEFERAMETTRLQMEGEDH